MRIPPIVVDLFLIYNILTTGGILAHVRNTYAKMQHNHRHAASNHFFVVTILNMPEYICLEIILDYMTKSQIQKRKSMKLTKTNKIYAVQSSEVL